MSAPPSRGASLSAFAKGTASSPGMAPLRPAARWVPVPPPAPDTVARLQQELLLPAGVCRLLAARGYSAPDAAKRFLRPRLDQVEAPGFLHDAARAVARMADAVRRQEVIFLHGDYDVDGMSSTALLTRVLRGCGARHVVPFVPNRLTDGYDLGAAGVAAARAAGASLVVTCDCGTSAHGAVDDLMRAGVDVIVTDHHLPGHGMPPAYAVCNPRHPACASSDKDLAAVGVAYKLALALCEALGVPVSLAHHQLDLVALATIADVAPLRGENRVLVRYGLKLLAETTHPGLRALIRSSGLEGKALTAGRVGFVLAPRLNAAGRIADAKLGLRLLLAEREDEANAIARELEELNRARQELDRAVLDDALRQVDQPSARDRFAHVLHREGWHAGVIGIVASRIVEQTARPAVLVAVEHGVGKGSGRSISAFDLHAALGECADLFQRYGGHRAAAGLTMDAQQLPAFVERFDEVAKRRLTADDLVPVLRVDLDVPLDDIGEDLEKLLRHFEPFGVGNPAPVFRATGARLASSPRKIGSDGLKFLVEARRGDLEAVGWGMAERAGSFDVARAFDLVFKLERDEYRGVSRLQLRVADVRHPGE
ncbi:single-stranded-DNA-specific exonuclease RecJ [Gemmatimonas sp.]|uniref:single-stranded-DNA-specific exonuclease RecJ n=1 Tax=Gemmatimonas sp. TaxID=1962908 RepID=UPI0025BB0A38|nr:single-stranded-DNA-specific exonuclease RecJ [Gemmatimonas sp.]MCA2991194.1 single-stranded-DNA-specific exonuclease RecJ [Gemmatimonas sp.]